MGASPRVDRCPRRNRRASPEAGHAAARRAAAAGAVRAPAVVPGQVPVLRFQFARGRLLGIARSALPGSPAGRPRSRAAVGVGPVDRQRVHRRRHAEPVFARWHRRAAVERAQPVAAGAGLRGHARSQPRHLRARTLSRVRAGRRQAAVDRRAELRRRAARAHRPRARRAAGPRRRAGGARGLRTLQPRPDVRAAGSDPAAAAARPRHRAGVRAAAPVGLPPDDRAQHAIRTEPAVRCPTTTWPATCST